MNRVGQNKGIFFSLTREFLLAWSIANGLNLAENAGWSMVNRGYVMVKIKSTYKGILFSPSPIPYHSPSMVNGNSENKVRLLV